MAIFTLLPLSISELREGDLLPDSIEALVYRGSYPRLYANKVSLPIWYSSYITTYIERDVRQVTTVQDLTVFKLFLRMCAGRIGQLLNMSSLANECGISERTVKHWLSILEASYIIYFLPPHFESFNKRLVKTKKLYFYDTGLACSLLDVDSEEQLKTHYLRGGLVENLIIVEFLKDFYNNARTPHLYFWRDNHGNELDCLIEYGTRIIPVEIKAGRTVSGDYFKGLKFWNDLAKSDPGDGYVVYSGIEGQKRSLGNVISWKNVDRIVKSIFIK